MTTPHVDALYQEIILDHYKRPHGRGLREPRCVRARSYTAALDLRRRADRARIGRTAARPRPAEGRHLREALW